VPHKSYFSAEKVRYLDGKEAFQQRMLRLRTRSGPFGVGKMKSRYAAYRSLVSPKESMLIVVDRLSDGVTGSQALGKENLSCVADLVDTTRRYSVPLVFATRERRHPNGNLYTSFKESIRRSEIIMCGSANPWEDDGFRSVVRAANRPRLIVAGQSSELCITFTVLSALEEGYEVYVVTDATKGASKEHHETAISRMAQAGAVPVTSRQIIFEWQRGSQSSSRRPDAIPSKKINK
jgi:nicotinamidase-related amidase